MAERSKRKLRKKRVTELKELGLIPGKLYSFQGRFRYLYNEQKPEWKSKHTKIRPGDYLMFIKADLRYVDSTKSKLVSESNKKRVIQKLKQKGYKIIKTNPAYPGFRTRLTQISYRTIDQAYSGMLFVGFGDKFGWINIVQMTKANILQQFNRVETTND